MTHDVSPQPFERFLESVASATYDEFRSLPNSEVESAAAFEEMRTYILDLYDNVNVDTSFVENDDQVIDCVPDRQHPAVRRSNGDIMAMPTESQPAPESYRGTPPPFTSPSTREVSDAVPRPQHQASAERRRQYPEGTTPMYRTTLEQLTRFRNLAAFSAKDRFDGAGSDVRAFNPLAKRYATGEQDVRCLGGAGHVNVWKPFATPTYQATFSQQWYMAGHDGTLLQTVECGWHIDMARYHGNADPHLFVYATRRNYDNGHSFFNQEGGAFKTYSNPYVVPGTPLFTSQTDGTQVAYKMGFYLTSGAWVFYFDDHPIGYYPLAWFQNGPLTQGATRIKFGGEVGSNLPMWPAMGSGRHASAGHGKAAYHRAAYFNPVGGGGVFADLREAGSTSGSCYTIDITNNSASEWGTYLFFGGPGGQPC
jgi:hypothetical protein